MPEYTLKEKTVITESLYIFIPNPHENDGSGWSYTLKNGDDYLTLESGSFRSKYLPTIISLLTSTVKEDSNRNQDNDSYYGMYDFDYDEKNEEDVSELRIGAEAHNLFIMTKNYVNDNCSSLVTVTLNRIHDTYYLYFGGLLGFSFSAWELEGVIALLEKAQSLWLTQE